MLKNILSTSLAIPVILILKAHLGPKHNTNSGSFLIFTQKKSYQLYDNKGHRHDNSAYNTYCRELVLLSCILLNHGHCEPSHF